MFVSGSMRFHCIVIFALCHCVVHIFVVTLVRAADLSTQVHATSQYRFDLVRRFWIRTTGREWNSEASEWRESSMQSIGVQMQCDQDLAPGTNRMWQLGHMTRGKTDD